MFGLEGVFLVWMGRSMLGLVGVCLDCMECIWIGGSVWIRGSVFGLEGVCLDWWECV